MARQPNLKQPIHHNFGVGDSATHSRSLSQPVFFASNCLPPLSPFSNSDSSLASANSGVKDLSMDEMVDVSSRGQAFAQSFHRDNVFRGGNESLPPRKGHRRSSSDIPLGFSDMIQSSPQLVPISGQELIERVGLDRRNLKDNTERLHKMKLEGEVVDDLMCSYMHLDNSSPVENKVKDSWSSGTKISGGDFNNTENDSSLKGTSSMLGINCREGVKRSAAGDITPTARHFRSLSVDSAFGNLNFVDESTKLHPQGNGTGQLSPNNSSNECSAKFSLNFGNGEFSEAEMKKIMADGRLAEIAVSDPKRVKRILANRLSAARSKERKLHYISELEHKVQTLQSEATTLAAQVTILQKDLTELTTQNSELKFRLQAMEQQAQLRDALHEALTAEVQRLKLEHRDEGRPSNCIAQQIPMAHHMFQMQHQQAGQRQPLSTATSKTGPTASATSASA